MKYRTSTFSSHLLSISKFVMIDWFTKSQHSLCDFVFECVQNDGGWYGKKHSRYIEGYSQGFNHIEFPWGSPGSWHEQRNVANKPKFFLSGNTGSGQAFSRNINSNHRCKHIPACKIKETTTRSNFSQRLAFSWKMLCYYLARELRKFIIESWGKDAASSLEFCSNWSERKLRSALEAVFKDKLDGLPAPTWV